MAEQVVIERRFRGPPESGQGGFSCGIVAERIAGNCATVMLRRPPPLERELTVESGGDGARLLDGDTLIAEGAADELGLAIPPAVPLDTALEASSHPFWGEHIHPF